MGEYTIFKIDTRVYNELKELDKIVDNIVNTSNLTIEQNKKIKEQLQETNKQLKQLMEETKCQ